MAQAGEPSVEEILDSIKKVIARDSRAEAAESRAQRQDLRVPDVRTSESRPEPRPDASLHTLRTVPGVPGLMSLPKEPEAAPPLAAQPEDVLELTDAEAPAAAPEPVAAHPDLDDDDLADAAAAAEAEPLAPMVADVTVAAMRESLAALRILSEPGAAPQIVRSGETSLEGLTRDLLRPMLAQWLQTHLPPMVEKLVTAEIARIVGKKG